MEQKLQKCFLPKFLVGPFWETFNKLFAILSQILKAFGPPKSITTEQFKNFSGPYMVRGSIFGKPVGRGPLVGRRVVRHITIIESERCQLQKHLENELI